MAGKLVAIAMTVLGLTPGAAGAQTFLGEFGVSGTGPGQFEYPVAVAADDTGNVYVGDDAGGRIQKFDSNGNFLTQFGSPGTGPGQLGSLWVALDTGTAGNVYVADRDNDRVQVFSPDGSFRYTFGMTGGPPGSSDGLFDDPLGVHVDTARGQLFVADNNNDRVQRFDYSGNWLGTFGQPHLSGPVDVATDAAGNVYVAEEDGDQVSKFAPDGSFITAWGTTGSGDGQFDLPEGIEIGPDGRVYVVEWGNSRVQIFDTSGNFLGKFGTAGTGTGELNEPAGLSIDCRGTIYIGNGGRDKVVKFGDPAQAAMPLPCGLFMDANGVRKQRVKKLTVTAICSEPCSLTGTGKAKDGDDKSKLKRATVEAPGNVTATLRMKLKKPKLADELVGGKATVTVTATDAADESVTETLKKVKLKR